MHSKIGSRSRGRSVPFLSLLSFFPTLCFLPAAADALPPPPQVLPPTVASVQIVGLQGVAEEQARAAIGLKPGDDYSTERLEVDRKALVGLGYFRRVGATGQVLGAKVLVRFETVEWPRVAHIRVEGNTVVDLRSVYGVITSQRGQVMQGIRLQQDIQAIERLYRERGYVGRVSDTLIHEATESGILRFRILEARLERLEFVGGDSELQQRCRAVLRERPPSLYRPEAVARDQQRLLGVRGIRTALPVAEPAGPGRVILRWFLNAAVPAPAAPQDGASERGNRK